MTPKRSIVRGCGAYLPADVVSNDDLARRVDTSDEWIVQRTGIRERRIARDDEYTSDLGLRAAIAALARAGVDAAEIDLIVLATSTPDYTFPATAVTIQAELGIEVCCAFDVQAVCSGFVYALSVADQFLSCGKFGKALVIGAETFSRILDWEDRATCVLFGDGAGAVVLESVAAAEGDPSPRGVLASCLRSDGRHRDKLFVDGGPSRTMTTGHLRMEGKEVFRHAVNMIADSVTDVLGQTGLTAADIDWFVPHQANRRIIDGVARKLDLPADKVIVTVDVHANTSAASIPLALAVGVDDGRIKPGDLVMMEAMGGGFTWGAVLVRW